MSKTKKIAISIIMIFVIAGGGYYFLKKNKAAVKQIDINAKNQASQLRNDGPVSPISGLGCENWNKRPVAVMQPSDIQARPATGFSEADMVFELPAYTSSVTRLMGVYICEIPKEIGAIRSARHDHIALAGGVDGFFIHWGGSHFALDLLSENVIDRIDCMTSGYCARWNWQSDPLMRMEDSGHITKENVLKAISEKGIRSEGKFLGYPHQAELPENERPSGGRLRVAFAKPYDVEYDYDKTTNSYLRRWAGKEDLDKNNGKRLSPKNVVVMFAKSEQITNTQDYKGKGLRDPWEKVETIKNTGSESISERYNNVQIGDPWYDESDNGPAKFYLNGQEISGTWKKDKSKIDSKLFFYDESGQEIMFVPGQIWVEILEPGQVLRWEIAN